MEWRRGGGIGKGVVKEKKRWKMRITEKNAMGKGRAIGRRKEHGKGNDCSKEKRRGKRNYSK